MGQPTLLVAGFGRSGTTMMMTMLDRGGFPCSGPRPAYEVEEMSPIPGIDTAWLAQQQGRAVKYIDPTQARISRNNFVAPPVIIHMDRDVVQMANSQAKLMETLFGMKLGRQGRKALHRSLLNDKPTLAAILASLGRVYSFTFGTALREPMRTAEKIATILHDEFECNFDIGNAASVPIARSPECAADMRIELGMVV